MVKEDDQNNWTTQPTYDALLIRYLPKLLPTLGKHLGKEPEPEQAQTPTEVQQEAKQEQNRSNPKHKQQHTLVKCSCGALLTKSKIAKHLRSNFHLNALSKKTKQEVKPEPLPTPTSSIAELDQLSSNMQRETTEV